MSHPILGLGMAALTLSGAVWYLPALIELRAGADRPVSTRIAASATVAGWGTAAALAVLLFLTGSWQVPGVLAGFGASVVLSLSVWARLRRREEEREEARRWAALRRNGRVEDRSRAPRSFAAWTLSGIFVAWAAATAVLLAVDVQGRSSPALAASTAAAISLVFLLIAVARVHAIRHAHAHTHAEVRSRVPR